MAALAAPIAALGAVPAVMDTAVAGQTCRWVIILVMSQPEAQQKTGATHLKLKLHARCSIVSLLFPSRHRMMLFRLPTSGYLWTSSKLVYKSPHSLLLAELVPLVQQQLRVVLLLLQQSQPGWPPVSTSRHRSVMTDIHMPLRFVSPFPRLLPW
jgi:hypothetical protein